MLIDILQNAKEEELQQYLTENENILIAEFGQPFWAYNIVIPKFRFGLDYISDFVTITGQSYSYEIHLIELEPANVSVFTKQGVYAARLNQAIKQVDEWGDWIDSNDSYFRKCLLQAAQKQVPDFDVSFEGARRFNVWKHIVIGRRNTLSDNDNIRRVNEQRKSNLDILTFDRLVAVEEKILRMEETGVAFRDFFKFER